MRVALQKANDSDRHVLKNLYSLYLHDLSRFTVNIQLGADGQFHFEDLNLLWNREGFSPYLIKREDQIIGFLLLLERPLLTKAHDYVVNDIFIIHQFRGKGYGMQALEKLFLAKTGSYLVVEMLENTPAILFWKKVYKHLDIAIDEKEAIIDAEPCLVQTFQV